MIMHNVSIKSLDWKDLSDGRPCHRAAPAVGPVYWVEDDGLSEKKYHVRAHHLVLGNVDDLDDAKAVAQADYEQRILSALVATPKPKATHPDAVAHIVTDPKGKRRVTLATQYDPMASAFWIDGEMPDGYSVTPLYAHPPKPEATEGGAHEKGIEAARETCLDFDFVVPTSVLKKSISSYLEASGLVLCDAKPVGYSMIDDDTGKLLSWTPDIEGTRWFNNYRATTYPVYRALTPSPALGNEKEGGK